MRTLPAGRNSGRAARRPVLLSEMPVRLRQPLRVNGIIWARGLVITLPKERAKQLVRMQVAEFAQEKEPGHAVGA